MKLAIIGQGPRGIQALFSLVEAVRARPSAAAVSLDVTCYDPQPPGFGAAYATDQPDSARLNVRPDIVELPGMPTFVDWLTEQCVSTTDVPRAQVGRYLAEMRNRLLATLPAGMSVQTRQFSVTSIRRDQAECWQVSASAPAGPFDDARPPQASTTTVYDEVLLTVGHAPPASPAFSAAAGTSNALPDPLLVDGVTSSSPRVVESVYPMRELLNPATVPPGSRVVVRGAALTFLDAALTLHAERPTGERPSVVIPTSRSGLLMNTKPVARLPESVETWLTHRARSALHPGPRSILTAPCNLAQEFLLHLHLEGRGEVPPCSASTVESYTQRVESVIRVVLDEPAIPGKVRTMSARDRLAHSVSRAEETARNTAAKHPSTIDGPEHLEADVEWALGRAWLLLYSDIVAALSWYSSGALEDWAEFRRQTARYERLTFGPTLPQSRRLLRLCDSGFVDTSWLDAGLTLDDLPREQWGEHADVVVNAVLAPPGMVGNDRPFLSELLEKEQVKRADDGRRGLLIDDQARCLDARGQVVSGLSCVGRVTEDVVIGHDTLNRNTHPHLERWAQRIGAKA